MIRETIITTTAADGDTHIAPMGIRQEGEHLLLAPFRPSGTLDNLLRERIAVVNYTVDVRVFAGCLTGRWHWPLVPADKVRCNRLRDALSHSELEVHHVEDDELRPRLLCKPVHEATHAPFRGFNRAQAAVIEAAVLVSRLHMLPLEKIEAEVDYLAIAIDKTAGAQEQEAWGWLMQAISQHREQLLEQSA
jgi:hypothetical protein